LYKAISNEYLANGVIVTPPNPETYKRATVVYNGLLSKSGAQEIYARVGFGCNWEGAQDIRMIKTNSGYEATIIAANAESLNVAFKDPLNNWDNNSGANYVFNIEQ